MNGRSYDATSGTLVHDVGQPTEAVTNLAPPKPPLKAIVKKPAVDGVVRVAVSARQVHAAPHRSKTLKRAATHNKAVKAAVVVANAARPAITAPKPQSAHAPLKSQTLMRHAVAKPAIPRKPALKAQTHSAAVAIVPPKGIVHKKMSNVVDPHRLVRASGTPAHPKVARFTKETRLLPAVTPVHVPVTPAPVAPLLHAVASPHQDMFMQAINAAQSHEQTYHAPKKRVPRRLMASVGASLAVLIVAGVIVGASKSSIEMQMASAQAGFTASKPSYVPAGYAFQSIERNPGQVTVAYSAVAIESKYKVIEQPSAWDSQTLVEAFLSTTKDTYDVYQRNGRTIYVYGDNATWVSGGVWYRILSSGHALPTEQLLAVATSL